VEETAVCSVESAQPRIWVETGLFEYQSVVVSEHLHTSWEHSGAKYLITVEQDDCTAGRVLKGLIAGFEQRKRTRQDPSPKLSGDCLGAVG